jgi:hypothetical protein
VLIGYVSAWECERTGGLEVGPLGRSVTGRWETKLARFVANYGGDCLAYARWETCRANDVRAGPVNLNAPMYTLSSSGGNCGRNYDSRYPSPK